MIKSIKTEVQLIHLKGHQDDDKEFEYETAPLSVRMNIDMDASAKLFLKQNQKQLNPNRITPFYTASKIALCIHGNVISKNMEAHIKLHKKICPTFTACYSDQIKSLARSVYQKQRQLGPRNLVKGFMIQEWESLQNICVYNRSTAASNIEWSSKAISALWEFSKSIWDGRCARVHEPNSNGTKSLKSTELLRVLETEIAELRKTRLEYDSQQLLRNIDIKKDKAQNHTIYKWLNMLRHRKEEEKRRKQHDQTNRIRARPITNWCDRGRGT